MSVFAFVLPFGLMLLGFICVGCAGYIAYRYLGIDPSYLQSTYIYTHIVAALERAGIKTTFNSFCMIWSFAFVASTSILALIAGIGVPLSLVIALCICLVTTLAIPKLKQRRRCELFTHQLSHALPMVASNIRCDFSLIDSFVMATEYLEDPIKSEMRHIAREVRVSGDLQAGFEGLAKRMESDDLQLISYEIAIESTSGGDIAAKFDDIAKIIRRRASLRRHIAAITSDNRLSVKFVAMMPVLVIAVFAITMPDYLLFFVQSPLGIGIGCVVLALEFGGIALAQHMCNQDID
ncbi:MAG: type II secretion system F family protein [Ruthenibacterium sp.]